MSWSSKQKFVFVNFSLSLSTSNHGEQKLPNVYWGQIFIYSITNIKQATITYFRFNFCLESEFCRETFGRGHFFSWFLFLPILFDSIAFPSLSFSLSSLSFATKLINIGNQISSHKVQVFIWRCQTYPYNSFFFWPKKKKKHPIFSSGQTTRRLTDIKKKLERKLPIVLDSPLLQLHLLSPFQGYV